MKKRDMTIDTKAVAHLARLSFSKEELLSFEKDMKDIIEFAATVTDCAESAQECFHTKKNVLREDTVRCAFTREELMSVSPSGEDGFFTVPKVVE